jgi:hypothetical protein
LANPPLSTPALQQVAGPNDQYGAAAYPAGTYAPQQQVPQPQVPQPGMYTQPYAPTVTAFTPAAVPPPAAPVPAAIAVPAAPGYDPIAVAAGVTLPGQAGAASAAAPAPAPAAAPPAPKEPLPPGLMWRSNMREQIPANASALPKLKVPEVRARPGDGCCGRGSGPRGWRQQLQDVQRQPQQQAAGNAAGSTQTAAPRSRHVQAAPQVRAAAAARQRGALGPALAAHRACGRRRPLPGRRAPPRSWRTSVTSPACCSSP